MNEKNKLKRKATIGMVLSIIGCLVGASGGVSDSNSAFIRAILGFALVVIGFVIGYPCTKKLKALQESDTQKKYSD